MLIIENWETTYRRIWSRKQSHYPTSQKLITINISIPVFPGSLLCINVLLVHLLNRVLSTTEQRENNILVLGKTNSLQYFQSKPKPCVQGTGKKETNKRYHTCSFFFFPFFLLAPSHSPHGKLVSMLRESLHT